MEASGKTKVVIVSILIHLTFFSILWGQGADRQSDTRDNAGRVRALTMRQKQEIETRRSKVRDLLNTIKQPQRRTESRSRLRVPRVSRDHAGFMTSVSVPRDRRLRMDGIRDNTPNEIAEVFLRQYKDLLTLDHDATTFRRLLTRVHDGQAIVRHQQQFGGLDVFAAQTVIKVDPNGHVLFVASDLMRDPSRFLQDDDTLNAQIDPQTAQRLAQERLVAKYPGYYFETTTPKLMIYDPAVLDLEGESRLVWQVKVESQGGLGEKLLLDALTQLSLLPA